MVRKTPWQSYEEWNEIEKENQNFNTLTFLPLPPIISTKCSEITNNLPLISCSENLSNTLDILDCNIGNFGGCMFNNSIPKVSCGGNKSEFKKSLSCVNIIFCSLQANENSLELVSPFCAY